MYYTTFGVQFIVLSLNITQEILMKLLKVEHLIHNNMNINNSNYLFDIELFLFMIIIKYLILKNKIK